MDGNRATNEQVREIRGQWGLVWPCPHCGSEEKGMHKTGGYTWDGDEYFQGPPCPFSPHREGTTLASYHIGILLDEIDRVRSEEIPAAVSRGAHTVIPAKERELKRARAAESLLRHVERLLRNEPNYQSIRAEIGKHLATYRDYEQRPPDEQVAS